MSDNFIVVLAYHVMNNTESGITNVSVISFDLSTIEVQAKHLFRFLTKAFRRMKFQLGLRILALFTVKL